MNHPISKILTLLAAFGAGVFIASMFTPSSLPPKPPEMQGRAERLVSVLQENKDCEAKGGNLEIDSWGPGLIIDCRITTVATSTKIRTTTETVEHIYP